MGFGGLTGFGSSASEATLAHTSSLLEPPLARSDLRPGFTSRASAASLTASTSSIVRQRFENLKTLTRRGPGSMSIRPRWSSSFSDDEMSCR